MSSYSQSQSTSTSQESSQTTTVEQDLQEGSAQGEARWIAGGGGYAYEQYPTGAIVIVEGPAGVGSRLTEGAAWEAITAEIGPYPQTTSTSESETPTLDAVEEEVYEGG